MSDWPEAELSPKTADPQWEAHALNNQLLRWVDTPTWEHQMTAAFLRIPVPIGLGWWGHLVCQMAPYLIDSKTVGCLIWNSWGDDWGDGGMGVLTEKKGTADLGSFACVTSQWTPNQ